MYILNALQSNSMWCPRLKTILDKIASIIHTKLLCTVLAIIFHLGFRSFEENSGSDLYSS